MTEVVFYVFAVAAVISATLCILQRNPVSAALWLVSTMFSLAAIYVLLNAQFIAAIQVLVYAGAVMVLFLFVIMLLNLGHAEPDMRGPSTIAATLVIVGLLAIELFALLQYNPRKLASEFSQWPAFYRSGHRLRGRPADPAGECSAGGGGRRRRSPVSGVSDSLRDHLDSAPGGDHRGGRARQEEGLMLLGQALGLSAVLFSLGVAGVLLRRNAIVLFMCIELMLNAVNLSFVALAQLHGASGYVMVFFVMTVAAAEAAVGLAIIIGIFRHKQTVDLGQHQPAPGLIS